MFRKWISFVLDPSPEGARALRAALRLPPEVAIDVGLGDVILEIPAAAEGLVRIDGRPLPAGRRVLLGGERIRAGRRRLRLLPAPPDRLRAGGTRTFARAALASPAGGLSPDGPSLVVLEGAAAGRRWPLVEGPQVVGRGLEADVVLPDPSVSRRHAELFLEAGAVGLRDLGSRHGLRAGGRRVRRRRALHGGEEIVLGAARLRLELPQPRPAGRAGQARTTGRDGRSDATGRDGRSDATGRDGRPDATGRRARSHRERRLALVAAALLLLGGAASTVALVL
jgi:hypothetical protein